MTLDILPILWPSQKETWFLSKTSFLGHLCKGRRVIWRSILSAKILLQMQKLNSFFELLAQPSIKVRGAGCRPSQWWQLCEDKDDICQVCSRSTAKTYITFGFPENDPLAQSPSRQRLSRDKVSVTFRNRSFTKLIKHQNHLWIFFSFLFIESETLGIAFKNVFLFFVFCFWIFLNSLSRWVNSRQFGSAFENKWFWDGSSWRPFLSSGL